MNWKTFALFALTAGMHITVHASDNVNTPENRQFLKQQENLSRQLREKPDHQLKAWAEKQVLENPLQRSDNHFLDELVRKQQASQDGKPRQGALYFVSFSIPEEGLKRMLGETRHYGIPATLRGMVNNDLKTTAEAVLSLVKDGATGRSCNDGADRWSGVVCRKIITPFLARGFFPGILRLSSGCAGRSGVVTGMILTLILIINKQHNTGYL